MECDKLSLLHYLWLLKPDIVNCSFDLDVGCVISFGTHEDGYLD